MPRWNSSSSAGKTLAADKLAMATEDGSGTQLEQRLGVQQVAPWASSAPSTQGRASVDACSPEAKSYEGDDPDAAWSPITT